jgi:peptidoglycan/xylan/chitin deacetylase (PgdA/CDA1 family)
MKKIFIFGAVLLTVGIVAIPAYAAIRNRATRNLQPQKTVITDPVVPQVVKPHHQVIKEPVILVYHTIEPKSNKKESKMQRHYHITPENFRAQMRYLKENGYSVISMKDYVGYLNSQNNVPEKSVVLTFDDGWKNQYTYAYPILKEFGYTATFYIITKVTDGKTYMSWNDIIDLDKNGMNIESHTQTHPNLTKIDAIKAQEELTLSKKTLEEKLGHPISMVAYPYYGNNPAVQKMVANAGYASARAGWTGTKNSKDTLFVLQSQEAVNNKNPFSAVVEK